MVLLLTEINDWLNSGEFVVKKQSTTLDQGYGNQSDGTLFLTNQQLVFQVSQSGIARGLDLKIGGQKDAKVEYIWIPLELVKNVRKKGLSIQVDSEGSIFQEIMGKTGLFGPNGEGRLFENGPAVFNFAMHIFVNKDEWVNEINSHKRNVLANQTPPNIENPIDPRVPEFRSRDQIIQEKIIIREVIKLKCPYCDTLYDQSNPRCPHCGGKQ